MNCLAAILHICKAHWMCFFGLFFILALSARAVSLGRSPDNHSRPWPYLLACFSLHMAVPAVAQTQWKAKGKSTPQESPLKQNTKTWSDPLRPPWLNTSSLTTVYLSLSMMGKKIKNKKSSQKFWNENIWMMWSYQKQMLFCTSSFNATTAFKWLFYISSSTFHLYEIKWSLRCTQKW